MARLDSLHKSPEKKTPAKNTHQPRPHVWEFCGTSENSDPNLPGRSSAKKPISSPAAKSATAKKSARKIPICVSSPPLAVQERKFIVAKRNNSRRGEKGWDLEKCQKAAYEALRASQEVFFRRDQETAGAAVVDVTPVEECKLRREEELQKGRFLEEDLEGSSKLRKIRSLMMEEAVNSMPEPGSGRVMHLVKAFENLLSISKEVGCDQVEESKKNVMNWALPGLRPTLKGAATEALLPSVVSSMEFSFPPRDFETDSRVYSSCDDSDGRLSFGSMASGEGKSSRRNCMDSLRWSRNKKLRVTSQHPFKLRTEERGMLKQKYFLKKVREMFMEEERKRVPIAQGLPWTTDEPECLVKPPVKETTEPVDLVLHSDVRAVERAAFDHYVSERMTLAEQIKMERERQRKLEEQDEIRKLRKELVPKAQPMPHFDRPFIPKKSTRPRTVPKEPRFHVHPRKACYKAFADMIKRVDKLQL